MNGANHNILDFSIDTICFSPESVWNQKIAQAQFIKVNTCSSFSDQIVFNNRGQLINRDMIEMSGCKFSNAIRAKCVIEFKDSSDGSVDCGCFLQAHPLKLNIIYNLKSVSSCMKYGSIKQLVLFYFCGVNIRK